MFKILKFATVKTPNAHTLATQQPKAAQYRQIWGWVCIAFNQVDPERLKLVGPNRLCAEWLLKNGAKIRIVEMPSALLFNYNALPPESNKFRIKEVDASDSSIMKIGLEHFRGCEHIDTAILHNCKHLEADGLEGIVHLCNSLQHLQVSGCGNMTDESFKPLGDLKKLRTLKLCDFIYVKSLDTVVQDLQKKLPNCKIETGK